MSDNPIERLAKECAGKIIDGPHRLPDGSGFAVMSMPLSKDHWIYTRGADGFSLPPPMPFRMSASSERRQELSAKVREAARYAVRGATMHGTAMDFDPDALIQNLIVGLFGYFTTDGLSDDSAENPNPAPPFATL